tara:strand:- start:387 stop:536 length:150 start_codon:yes stop_codon:yes gene_type:complete
MQKTSRTKLVFQHADLVEDIGNVTHYKGKPFTGTLYALRGELKTRYLIL